MAMTFALFLAVLVTVLALIPGAAHLLELPNKIRMRRDQYVTAQKAHRGWPLFAVALVTAVVVNVALAVALRAQPVAFWLAVGAVAGLVLSLAIVLVWTGPAEQAASDWTEAPSYWKQLRRRWENSHAAGAGLTFVSFCCITLAALLSKQ